MTLEVTRAAIDAMLSEAEKAGRNEACGLLVGQGDLVAEARSAANVAPDPSRHFEIDPQALIDAHRAERGGGARLIGYYHSHPNGLAEPSATDRESASGDGRVWAIVAKGDVSFWRDAEGGFHRLSYHLVAE